MNIYIGADHNGFKLKEQVINYLKKSGYQVVDVGDKVFDPDDDFPKFASQVTTELLTSGKDEDRGILICGSGQGMCMAANRFKGIRAALVWDVEEAKLTRNDNDSNVLCLPSRVLDDEKTIERIIQAWLDTPFAKATRYSRRNKQLDEIN